jgi:hypothetical protein
LLPSGAFCDKKKLGYQDKALIPTGADGRPDAGRWTGLMLYLQKIAEEPWEWSILPEELGQFLEETGWTIAHGEPGGVRKHGVEFYAVATK